ncbi:Spy/CpxP family protein refolding chaperone [Aliiglaciecola litoralis]|uniref:LTXXQ motif family protein n=1 Tax=Aliiglaciecola litoralis TaxID=582857 RepID=A0ABN1LPP7_9ALTE
MQNRNSIRNIVFFVSATALFSAAGASAHSRHEQPIRAMLQQLDLDQQQRQDLRALMQQSKQDRQVFKIDLKSLKQQMDEVIRADQWDQQRATTIIQQKQHIDAQLALSRANNKHTIWNTLSADQQQQFDTLVLEQRQQKQDKRARDPMKRFARLNLSDEQHSQISALIEAQRSQRQLSKANLSQFRQQQAQLIKNDEFDQTSWLASYQQMQQNQMELAVSVAHARHQIWNTLDQQQQAKMLKMENKRKHKQDKKRDRNRQHHQQL